MSHSEKVEHLLEDLGNRGISDYTIAPPLYLLLWKLGLKVRPPFFQSFITLFLSTGIFGGVSLGAIRWILQLRSGYELIISSAVFGVLLGLSSAIYYRWKARKLGLPEWEKYPNT